MTVPLCPTQETNLKNCKANMATTEKDLLTIRGFKTTTEVRACHASWGHVVRGCVIPRRANGLHANSC